MTCDNLFAVSLHITTLESPLRGECPVVRSVPHIPIACHANRQTDMSARLGCPASAGHERMLVETFLRYVQDVVGHADIFSL